MQNMYDLIIIGAGPGGYVAGIRASQLGLKACIVEKQKVGGVCLNVGCIPTKNIIYQADIFESSKELNNFGVEIDTEKFDFTKVLEKSKESVETLVKGVESLLKKNKVDLVQKRAKIVGRNSIMLDDGKEIYGRNIIIATGSRPLQIPGFEFDEKKVLSSTGILNQKKLPKKIIILGGGAIGCEFAHIMNAFGVNVIIVEMQNQLLPFEDEDNVAVLNDSFTKRGIEILTNTRALSITKTDMDITVTIEDYQHNKRDINADQVLCVFGRTPNTDDIGLENIGLTTEKGYISVDNNYQTAVKNVFAIGDVVATPQLAHVASKEAEIAVEYIAKKHTKLCLNYDNIPSGIYCEPQVASFGLREKKAKEENIPYRKTIFPYRGVGKAVAVNKTEGKIKILTDPQTGEILGGHIIGHEATELIHELLLAKSSELLPEDIGDMIHAHPTFSELIREGMLAVLGKAIHY
ncbi:dihydrolipoamide dehydrogenase [Desulforhopalus singaporensis]|uniref:Dihydrolipoyl dehydrogenase n=2 Tax=Desulforhopalus singaporensis TaxID=91360 RepID=A0A1H0VVG8_9BACT|nr:dihydrolipoamide dehydrogenase [Desulforhopalus singaporensis]